MPGEPPTRSAKRLAFGVGLAIAIAVAVALFFDYFAGRPPWDDEGYMIVSLNGVAEGHRLYDDVFSQYGPAFFLVLAYPLRLFGLEWTIETARFATVAMTFVTGALMGWSVRRVTGSTAFGVAAGALIALTVGAESALHPTHLLLLLAAVAIVGVTLLDGEPSSRFAIALTGGAVGLALLVKINVGILLAAAVVYAVGDSLPRPLANARPYVPVAVALSLGWFALVGGHASLYLAGLIAPVVVFTVAVRPSPRGVKEPPVVALAIAAIGAVVACVVMFALDGSSLAALLRGVVLDPLGQAEASSLIPPVGPNTVVWLLVDGALAAAARRRRLGLRLRVSAAVVILANIVFFGHLHGVFRWDKSLVAAGLSAVLASTPRAAGLASGRLLAAACVLLPLMSFPVAGGQVNAGFLAMPALAFVALADARDELATREQATTLGVSLAAIALSVVSLVTAASNWSRLTAVPGAALVRTNQRDAEAVAGVTRALQRHCRTFYSLPGLNSFYLFANLEPPTEHNATTWMTLFGADRQADVVRDLESVEGLCVIRSKPAEQGWLAGGTEQPGPLRAFLEAADALVARHGDYRVFRRAE